MATSDKKDVNYTFYIEAFDEKATRWNRWVKRFETALEIFGAEADKKTKLLLHYMGTAAYDKLCDKALPKTPEELRYGEICDILEKHYNPTPNEIFLNYKFHSRKQEATESSAEFLVALRHLAVGCEFGEYCNKALRNQFVYGLTNKKIQGRLLERDKLSLDDAVNLAQMFEQAEKGFEEMNKREEVVEKVHMRKANNKEKRTQNATQRMAGRQSNCNRCGSTEHGSSECRHIETICNYCKKKGHLRRVCFKARKMMNQISDNDESENDDPDQEVLRIDGQYQSSSVRDKILCTLSVNGKNVVFEVDTGAPVTIMSLTDARKYFSENLKIHEPDLELYSYCKTPIDCAGYMWVQVKANESLTKVKLYLVRAKRKPLLGREWLRLIKLDWVKMIKNKYISTAMVNKIQENAEQEVGKITGCQARLRVKAGAIPKCVRARRVPFPLLQAVEDELSKQVEDGLLVKVERSEWASPIVVVRKKDNNVRICGDYKITINPNLVIDKHPLPTIDELFSTMAGGSKYSKIDLSKAYLQLEVHPDDQPLLTLSTHRGLFQPTRLMFGIASAPSQWQRFMEHLLADIPGVKVFLDDIKITASDDKLHMQRLEEVLSRLDKYNMRVNLDKSEFLQDRIEYCGYVIDKHGICKMPAKIKAIQNMKRPTNKEEVRSFLGLVNYYGRFIKNLSSIVYPLNRLLHKDVVFNFDTRCDDAFREVRKQISSDMVLTHYDPNVRLTLAVDASPTGVGAVLSHEFEDGTEKPIQFASQTLNDVQRRYSQVDKEAYAVIFGVRKFYQYVYGRQFTLITDNKAISQIFAPDKGLPILSATRMQHYAIFLESFDFKIRLRKSKDNSNADALSRLPMPTTPMATSEIDQIEMDLIENLPVTVGELSAATKKDPEIKKLMNSLTYGRTCDSNASFGIDPMEFTLQQGCLLRGIRVYIPQSLRARVMQELHSGHFGVSKMKTLARAYCWWKNLDRDIEQLVSKCTECQVSRPNVRKEPVHSWVAPKKVFERVHVDYAGPFLGKYFFVFVDAYSKWPEVRIVPDITTESTIEVCRNIFAQFGIPNVMVSDHGTQFKSAKFKKFLEQNGIIHKMGAPYHPATNGQAERFVQTFKGKLRIMNQKPSELQKNLDQVLLAYRRAMHPVTNKSPAMIMFGRQIQTRLDLLLPNNNIQNVERQKTLRDLKIGDRVTVRDYLGKQKWKWGVVQARDGDLHYNIRLDDGRNWRRHIDQIRSVGGQVETTINASVQDTQEENINSRRNTHLRYEPSTTPLESMLIADGEPLQNPTIELADTDDNMKEHFTTPPNSPAAGSPFLGFEDSRCEGEAIATSRSRSARSRQLPQRLRDYDMEV